LTEAVKHMCFEKLTEADFVITSFLTSAHGFYLDIFGGDFEINFAII